MRKKKKGATLEEKVKKHLEKVKKKGAVTHMIDTFFAPVQEHGNDFYVRYTNL